LLFIYFYFTDEQIFDKKYYQCFFRFCFRDQSKGYCYKVNRIVLDP
jgi:hypothetical protein